MLRKKRGRKSSAKVKCVFGGSDINRTTGYNERDNKVFEKLTRSVTNHFPSHTQSIKIRM
jgi:hypothetical protein